MAIRALILFAAFAIVPAVAFAQVAPAGPPAPPTAPAPAAGSASAAPSAVTPATGYGWSKTPARASSSGARVRAVAKKAETPDDVLAGFEELSDGGSRFYVEMAKAAPVDEMKAPGSVTYVMHGVRVKLRNNTNALVTVHFNTPAYRARLVPHGKDLLFVIDLRSSATPSWRIVPGKDGTSILQVDFPRGDFLNGPPVGAPGPAAPTVASSAASPAR